ncbi:EscU/YscU/HrcU family type III secretion system export apparatus switch protein [Phenylobacterium sp.]|uniref:EscU/YscU/HrcU family type III secretion system export apparatus switch protein n=1 Tax=Phenylobacterium sp. TaxID=1871053 RepID=UPI0030F47435
MSPDRRLAVALQYEAPGAPRVVAAGRGLVGERIIAAAEAHGVPLEQNPMLAEALSKVELDTEIPERLFLAVAEVLAFLMREGSPPEA